MTEPVRDYELRAFFSYVVNVLERLNIPYMVVGGFAAIFYGEPRLTLDVDVVIDMKSHHVSSFVAAFPIPDYYASSEGIRDSLRRRFPFNVIQPSTGAKVDLVPLPRDLFTRIAFDRRIRLQYDTAGNTAAFITPEDIVLAKLIAFHDTELAKHLNDARGVLMMQWDTIKLETIRRGARASGVGEQLEELVKTLLNERGRTFTDQD
jgi:hypothetical protein